MRRETDSWRYALFMAGYLLALAYSASWITYRLALLRYWMPAGLRRRLGRVRKRLGEKPGCGACSMRINGAG